MTQYCTIICGIFLLSQLATGVVNAFPEKLTVQVRNGNENIVLNWKRTDQYLANTNLPIWRAWRNEPPQLDPGWMEKIGSFSMYHDTEKSSAIILFHKQQRIYGVIDTRFYINALPLNEVGPHIHHSVDEGYVHRRPETSSHDDFYDLPVVNAGDITYVNSFERLHSPPNPVASNINPVLNPQAGPSHGHPVNPIRRVGDTLYVELLVFISNDVLRHFTRAGPDLKLMIAYYLIHFNSIDMLFAKLADHVKIHINIAGLVLESEKIVFPFAFLPGQQPLRELNGAETLERFPSYIKKYNDIFTPDSFDFFFVSTRYKIRESYEPLELPLLGMSRVVNNYDIRRNSRAKYDASGVIMNLKPSYTDYVDAAHELTHLMRVSHDPTTVGRLCNGQQCFAIIQESGSNCRNCIRWSDPSKQELQQYSSSNLDHCFLLNLPRSLYPYDVPLATVGPGRQCTCFNFRHFLADSHLDEVTSHRCDSKLACSNNNRPDFHTIPKPIDGTPCGNQKVCWRGECEALPINPMVHQLK